MAVTMSPSRHPLHLVLLNPRAASTTLSISGHLPFRPSSMPTVTSIVHTNRLPRTFARHAATSRRMTKLLRTKPAPSAAVGAKYMISATNHIVFNPPPSAPSPYETPYLFLPHEDPRRALLAPSSSTWPSSIDTRVASSQTSAALRSTAMTVPKTKSYHLTTDQILKIRQLRASDPWTWTRARLAKEFGCTDIFVSMCAPVDEKRVDWVNKNLERTKERWGPKRRTARDERIKRRALWGRDE